VFIAANRASTLEDEFERLSDETWLVVMLALSELRELSTLEEELDSCNELAFIVARFASMLEDEFERLRLDV
jgi:hypothetical protein